jgi:adenosylcobyric acid synthase
VFMAKAIFVGGTASHAGKSWMTTAICAWLRREGYRVAPFKAQNMSNNSWPCREGGEIGRAQVTQAMACGLEPEAAMNPVLLKPDSDRSSQIVVMGKVWKRLPAREYFQHTEELRGIALEAFHSLSRRFDVVVMEGAGSVAELNLLPRDFVNLSMAKAAGAHALLVSDIDRGGVFAALAGTLQYLPAELAALVRSFAVNRFRGDLSLFDDGRRILEELTGRPCLGVFPYAKDFELPEEDGVAMEDWRAHAGALRDKVAILAFPRISNLTDFQLLRGATWIDQPGEQQFQAVVLPGSKSTIGDLRWLRAQGLEPWLKRQLAGGARVLGVCGGYQMLGESIADPHGSEGPAEEVAGLGLLPVRTVLQSEKTTQRVEASTRNGVAFPAYEIHTGKSVATKEVAALTSRDGAVVGNVAGTYLHGALEHADVVREWLGVEVPPAPPLEQSFARAADWFAASANLTLFRESYL